MRNVCGGYVVKLKTGESSAAVQIHPTWLHTNVRLMRMCHRTMHGTVHGTVHRTVHRTVHCKARMQWH